MDGPSKIEIDRDMINNREQKSVIEIFRDIYLHSELGYILA